jgi:hypothetical protein
MSGIRFSRMDRMVTAGGSSLVDRLASRSVTGYDLPLQVHQHEGYALLLTWEFVRHGVSTEASVKRQFYFEEDIDAFCRDLIEGKTLGLCSCVFPATPEQCVPEHVPLCLHTNRSERTRWWANGRCRFCFCIVTDCRCQFWCDV